jgi:hypothetical protein
MACMEDIEANGYDATACRLFTYYKLPTYQLEPIEDYWVPFICQVKPVQQVLNWHWCLADPKRGIAPVNKFHAFSETDLMMYHFSYVRRNLLMKLTNHCSPLVAGATDETIKAFEDWQPPMPMPVYPTHSIKIVPDKFGIAQKLGI